MVMHFILTAVHVHGPVGQALLFFGKTSAMTYWIVVASCVELQDLKFQNYEI
jgi:hypothetical protein